MTADRDHLQLSLGVDQPHDIHYLFSDHYLEDLLPADPRREATRLRLLQRRVGRQVAVKDNETKEYAAEALANLLQ